MKDRIRRRVIEVHERKCVQCGEWFVLTREDARYCGATCRSVVLRTKRAAKGQKMATPKVMKLLDPSSGLMECKVCGARHVANIRPQSRGNYYRGAWQCLKKCKLPSDEDRFAATP